MNELQALIEAIQGFADMDEELLTDEAMQALLSNLDEQFSPALVMQSVNQIIQNLENQGLTKQDAQESINGLSDVIKEMVYGETVYSGNKKVLMDAVMEHLFDIFNTATEKYHSYAIELPIQLEDGAQVPTYAHDSDAAADLYAADTVVVEPHTLANKIRTGVHIQLPEGWVAFILPRSSIGAKTPLRLSNSAGVIDAGYRGSLGVLYDNIGNEPYTINAGDRIAQLLVMPSYRFKAKVVDSLEDSDRGSTGFGDSGK